MEDEAMADEASEPFLHSTMQDSHRSSQQPMRLCLLSVLCGPTRGPPRGVRRGRRGAQRRRLEGHGARAATEVQQVVAGRQSREAEPSTLR